MVEARRWGAPRRGVQFFFGLNCFTISCDIFVKKNNFSSRLAEHAFEETFFFVMFFFFFFGQLSQFDFGQFD